MAYEAIEHGSSPGDRTGEALFYTFAKIKRMFIELYSLVGTGGSAVVSELEYVLAASDPLEETTVPGADFTPPITVEPRIIQATVNGSLIDQVVRYEQNGSNYDIVLAPTDEELTIRICVL